MNHEAILAVLPDSKDDAKSLKEIANEMGLNIASYIDWIPRREAAVQFFEISNQMGLGGFGAEAERRRTQILVQCLLEDRIGKVGGLESRKLGEVPPGERRPSTP